MSTATTWDVTAFYGFAPYSSNNTPVVLVESCLCCWNATNLWFSRTTNPKIHNPVCFTSNSTGDGKSLCGFAHYNSINTQLVLVDSCWISWNDTNLWNNALQFPKHPIRSARLIIPRRFFRLQLVECTFVHEITKGSFAEGSIIEDNSIRSLDLISLC